MEQEIFVDPTINDNLPKQPSTRSKSPDSREDVIVDNTEEYESLMCFLLDKGDYFSEDLSEDEIELPDLSAKNRIIGGNRVVFPNSGITVKEVLQMHQDFCLRFGLTDKARQYFMELLNICAGPTHRIKTSNYKLTQLFNPPDKVITYHFYCDLCKKEVHRSTKKAFKNHSVLCNSCQNSLKLSFGDSSYFLTFDLEYVFTLLLSNEDVKKALLEGIRIRNLEATSDSIADVKDGTLCRDCIRKHPKSITLTASTDGAPTTKSGRRGFWPLQAILNELPPEMRFQFVLLLELMIVKKEPDPEHMNLFLDCLIEQADAINAKGGLQIDGEFYEIIILIMSADSVAKPLMQNRKSYSGYFGCGYCYKRGVYFDAVKYPGPANEELRNHEAYLVEARRAELEGSTEHTRGSKGFATLSNLDGFDMVWGFSIDYLHNILLRVTPTLIRYLNLSKVKKEILNVRMECITPSHGIKRLPRLFTDNADWKAEEWKAFLLYYGIPLCWDLLSEDALWLLSLLASSLFKLLKTVITPSDIEDCKKSLKLFCEKFQELFKDESVTCNVHLLEHVVLSVLKCGPLWAVSTFPFEGNIYILKQMVNGPKGIEDQMGRKFLQLLERKCRKEEPGISDVAQRFSQSLFSKSDYTSCTEKFNDVYFFGKSQAQNNIKSFTKCIYKHKVFHSIEYKRATKFNDCFFTYGDGKFAEIISINYDGEKNLCYFQGNQLIVEKLFVKDTEIPHIWEFKGTGDSCEKIINGELGKATLIKFPFDDHEEKIFICSFPNYYE